MITVYFSLAAIFLTAAVVSVGNGLLQTFLPVRMQIEGFTTAQIGAVVTAHAIGFLVSCLVMPRIIRAVGHTRCMLGCALVLAIVMPLFPLTSWWPLWFVLRLLAGCCLAGLFVAIESWITDRAPMQMLGAVYGSYFIISKLTFSGGQLLLATFDPAGIGPFLAIAACFVVTLVPVSLNPGQRPTMPDRQSYGLDKVFAASPLAVTGACTAGFVYASANGVGPVFATVVGFGTAAIAWFAALIQLGNVVSQYPLGWLSDRVDRRRMMLAIGIGTAILCLIFLAVPRDEVALLLLLAALLGGIGTSIYPLALGRVAARVEKRNLVGLNGTLLLCFAAGGIAGPATSTVAMTWLGPYGLFVAIGAATSAFALHCLWRLFRR